MDLRHLELEQPAQKALVRPADVDLRPARGASYLEHVRLDVLADAVVLDSGLLGRRKDRLNALADVEDDRPRLDAIDSPGDHLAFAAGELVEDDVSLRFTKPLQDNLLCGLRVDPPESLWVQLLGFDEVANPRIRLEAAGLVDRELGEWILDLADNLAGAKYPLAAGLGVNSDVDVFAA